MSGFQLFEYERLIKILLHGVSKTEQEGFVQRIAIYLLNTLACQVDGRQKLFLGELGVVSVSVLPINCLPELIVLIGDILDFRPCSR